MTIDRVSRKLIVLALYLDSLSPGAVSEFWLPAPVRKELKQEVPKSIDLDKISFEINSEITLLLDRERRSYLSEIAKSIIFQITAILEDEEKSFADFNRNCFGIIVERASEVEIKRLDDKIIDLESRHRKSRYDVLAENRVDKRSLLRQFSQQVEKAKIAMPPNLALPESESFSVSSTSRKVWSAFNKHVAPFKSELIINKDFDFTTHGLANLAAHEGYGGHHTELSLKDKLLVNEGRGEHSFVLTFSPQTFISEAIAESAYQLHGLNPLTRESMLIWYYEKQLMALQNLAVFLHFEDGLEKQEIMHRLDGYDVSETDLQKLVNFATDKKLGRYAHIYHAGFRFLQSIIQRLEDKSPLIKRIYTRPVTPNMLLVQHAV